MNSELSDVQAGFRRIRGTRDQIANIHWIIEKAREVQKNIYFCFIDCTKAFDFVAGKFLKLREYQTTLPSSWEICMQVKKQLLELEEVGFHFNPKEEQRQKNVQTTAQLHSSHTLVK